ncbi:putative membrane protein YedE/YeeE [Methanococcus voltae]|nr:YeeE/YedE thiosulfate transporter family protein [Methanococcus voltae]MBP2143067.1 putative membrane protein YedE/YeeE [Methanococcus voltae]
MSEVINWLPAIGTLIFGAIIGYLGQRSALCFCGGIRDMILIKDSWLFKGLVGFIGGALVTAIVFSLLGQLPTFPWIITKGLTAIPGDAAGNLGLMPHLIVTVIGGIGVGIISVIQGGCPFRNLVMAGEGNKTAIAYVFGMVVGAIIFHQWVVALVQSILA